jgi:hypothetical protein
VTRAKSGRKCSSKRMPSRKWRSIRAEQIAWTPWRNHDRLYGSTINTSTDRFSDRDRAPEATQCGNYHQPSAPKAAKAASFRPQIPAISRTKDRPVHFVPCAMMICARVTGQVSWLHNRVDGGSEALACIHSGGAGIG